MFTVLAIAPTAAPAMQGHAVVCPMPAKRDAAVAGGNTRTERIGQPDTTETGVSKE